MKIWQGYHGISDKTDERVITTTGYNLREVYTGGKYHGYPECCILHWLEFHEAEKAEIERGNPDLCKYADLWNGFIPCPEHRAMIDAGDIKIEDLIKNRLAPLAEHQLHRVVGCDEDERYGMWLRCNCGYEPNAEGASFCGGCGHRIELPDFVKKAHQKGVICSYLKEGQWYADVWKNYVRYTVALQPELNGDYVI